jgi:hypothetical protein
LSLVLCSRNDRYQGNSLWRLQTALNYAAQGVYELGRLKDVEVLVADWGSAIPLRDVLELTPAAADIVSFVHVPPDIARVVQKDSPFPEVLALNTVVRRARGEYIGRIDQDTLVGKRFLERFFWLHEKPRLLAPLESSVLLSNRRRIPYRFAVRCPSFWVTDRFLRCFGRLLPLMEPPPPHLYYQSYIGILLFHRDLWHACGGYDERFIYMDFMEFDIILRLTRKFHFVNLGELVDHDFYHLDHGHPMEPWSASRGRKANPVRDLDNPPETFKPNTDRWGLVDYELPPLPALRGVGAPLESHGLLLNWMGFALLTLLSGAQIAWDNVVITIWMSARRLLLTWLDTWRWRLRVAYETITGEPVLAWPRLLFERWNRKSSQ